MRMRRIICSIIVFILVSFGICACKNTDSKELPTSNYEKVQFAFNGVEKSLKNTNSSLMNLEALKKMEETRLMSYTTPALKMNEESMSEDDIQTIYNAMSLEKETSNPSFPYDEPPMIQFQYLKALYEEVGDSFSFGKKYTYTLTGDIYYDFSTRSVTENEEFLQNYSFDLSIRIDIDENDIIKAFVGFDLKYTNKGFTRNQKRYAELVLNYDMNDVNPTYTLAMKDMDDLLSYSNDNEKYINAEYDYVNVDKNVIQEWRKFGICSNEPLSNYQNNDFVFKYSVLRAFKENKLYHIENSYNPNANLKSAVINGFDFNRLIQERDTFHNEEGIQNDKIQTIANKFSTILGKDFVNSIVYTGATEKWVDDNNEDLDNLFLRIESTGGYQVYEDTNLADLFDPNKGFMEKEHQTHFDILYKNGEDNLIATYNNFDNLNVKVKSNSYTEAKWINVDNNQIKTIAEYIEESGFKASNIDVEPIELEVDMSLKSNSNVKLQSTITIELNNEECYRNLSKKYSLVEAYIDAYTKIKDAIPDFESESVYYTPIVYENGTTGTIGLYASSGLEQEVNTYIDKIKGLNFIENENNSTYTKRINDSIILVLTVNNVNEKNPNQASIQFEYITSTKPEKTITEAIMEFIDNENITIPSFNGDYEYSIENNIIKIKNMNGDYISKYIQSLSDYGFIVGSEDGYAAAYKYVDHKVYGIKELGYSIAVLIAPVTVSLVGDLNNWAVKDSTYDLTTLTLDSSLHLQIDVDFNANSAFKLVKNHSWNDGGYGFNLLAGSPYFDPMLYECGESENIIIKEAGSYKIDIRFFINNSGETISFDILELNIQKNNS